MTRYSSADAASAIQVSSARDVFDVARGREVGASVDAFDVVLGTGDEPFAADSVCSGVSFADVDGDVDADGVDAGSDADAEGVVAPRALVAAFAFAFCWRK